MPTVFIIGTVSGGAEVQGLTTFGHHSERKHFQPSEPCASASALVGNATRESPHCWLQLQDTCIAMLLDGSSPSR